MKISDSDSLGYLIKRRRKELGLTQTYISEFTGLSASFISNVENGKESAEIGKVIMLLNILGLDIDIKPREE